MGNLNQFVSIIPIRSGSKGLKNKNTKLLKGIPLYKHTLFQSLRIINKTIISTDIDSVINSQKEKNTLVLKRQKNLCTDSAEIKDVLLDIIQKKDLQKKVIVLLQVTSPLRSDLDIIEAIKIYEQGNFSMVMSVTEGDSSVLKYGFIFDNKFKSLNDKKYNFANRQQLPKVYKPNGAIYIFSAKEFLRKKSFPNKSIGCYVMPNERSIDIDNEEDFKQIERTMNNNPKE